MKTTRMTPRLIRSLFPVILGMALVLGLLWVLTPRSEVAAQAPRPTLEVAVASNLQRPQGEPGAPSGLDHTLQITASTSEPASLPPPQRGGRPGIALSRGQSALPAFSSSASTARGLSARDGSSLAAPVPGSADLVVCVDSERVWGVIDAGETATVTVNGAQMGATPADANGFFWTTLLDGSGDRPGLGSGDAVAIYADGVQEGSVTLRSISGQIDHVNDVVSGTIGGAGQPISVTVYAGSGEPAMTTYSQTVSTDGSGDFSVDFDGVFDFIAWHYAVVAYVESGVEVHRQVYPIDGLLVRPEPWNVVMGTAAPDAVVTATLYDSSLSEKESVTLTADAGDGWYYWSVSNDVEQDDVVVVELDGGVEVSRTVDALSVTVDAANERVTGEATPGATVRGLADRLTPLGWREVFTSATVDAGGAYTLEFSGIADILPGNWVGVFVADAEGDDLNLWNYPPSVQVNQTFDDVYGRGPSAPGPESEGRTVTLTLYSATLDESFVCATEMDWWGWYDFGEWEDYLPDIASGDSVTVEADGYAWQGVIDLEDVTVQHDLDADRFTGTVVTPTDWVQIWAAQWEDWGVSYLYPVAGSFNAGATASSPFTVTLSGFDLRNAVGYDVYHRAAGDGMESIYGQTDWVRVWPWYNGLESWFSPKETVYTITLRDGGGGFKAQLTGTSSEDVGESVWDDFGWSGVDIEPGDQLQAQSAAGFSQTVDIPEVTIEVDGDADRVSGTAPSNVLLYVEVDNHGRGFVPVDEDGQFVVAADQLQESWSDGDVRWGDRARACLANQEGNQLCWEYRWPSLIARYQMDGRNEVWGQDALPGNTIYVTVTHPISGVVAAGTTYAGTADWAGRNGYQLEFDPGAIVPGNRVDVDFGGGFTYSTTVVSIAGQADPDSDVVTITAPVDSWVYMNADDPFDNRWESNWSYGGTQVGASGYVTFDLSVDGFDVVYGTQFNVHVEDTQYTFWLPAPELWVNKWTTPGVARPGGIYLYGISYRNNGSGAAADTLITDTLPPSTTYAYDSSGLTAIDGGAVVTWQLGTVLPGDEGRFYVALNVDSAVPTESNLASNCVGITTSSPGETHPDNDHSCSGEAWVDEAEIGAGVDKWPDPYDPHPGQEYAYEIEYWSNASGASGPTWLTDTLPVSTTLVRWEEQWGWEALWTEVVTTGGQLVLYAPAGIPGDMSGRIRLTLLLDPDVPVGTLLVNKVVLTTDGDDYPEDNEDVDTEARASNARYDMRAEKGFNEGELAPGGWMRYHVIAKHDGNAAVHVWVTDTLPAGTSYREGSAQHCCPWEPFEPLSVTSDYVVWDMGVLGVGQEFGFNLELDVEPSVVSGTVMDNCATVGTMQTEASPANNQQCSAQTIYDAGPNLRVSKEGDWREDNQIGYRIHFENVGTETIQDVWVTDTLPLSTAWDGWWDMDFDWDRLASNAQSSDQLSWHFSELYPGDSGWLYLNANLDDPDARPRWYTNTVDIDTPPGDVNPEDNASTDVLVKGEVDRAELRVGTDHSDMWGEAQPGSMVTVTTAYRQEMAWADPDCGGCWDIDDVGPVDAGDQVVVEAGAALMPVVIDVPDPFTAYASSITDTVWGQLGTQAGERVLANLDGGPEQTTQTGSGGHYSFTFAYMPRGSRGEVRYYERISYAEVILHHDFATPDLVLRVNYGHDWIEGNYEVGHTLWITVTESDGSTIKATALLQTQEIPWWGDTGFSTNLGDPWAPGRPDMQPGDWVTGTLDNGDSTAVRIGTINGELDLDADTVSGTIHANWFTEMLRAWCGVWEDGGPGQGLDVDPDGGSYLCDFTGEWDLLPGDTVGVSYTEPENNQVYNAFSEPAADLWTNKNGQEYPAPGGNYSYRINYGNGGDGVASGVVLTDALPTGMTYLTDTSGLPSTLVGNTVVWEVGVLDGDVDSFFDVYVEVDPGLTPGTAVGNVVEIWTPDYERDPGDNYNEWWTEVRANDTHLDVGKDSWTGDPAPDTDIVFNVSPCNYGETASSEVTLTDTLHPALTLVDWWSDASAWSEVSSSAQQLVVSRPSIPGHDCQSVYLRVHVDAGASPGTYISNTAVISASNDLEDDDNETYWDGNVNEPHANLSIDKSWSDGQLTPGGKLRYWIDYGNDGNVPVGSIQITDTLPADTSFVESWWWRPAQGWEQITPTVGSGYVVWDVGTLENGYNGDLELRLAVDGGATPGTVLTNTVEISRQPQEDGYDDNQDQVVETLYEEGPNLRVRKWSWWDGDGQLDYQIEFENVGSETVYNVWLTDTYPVSTTAANWPDWNYWQNINVTDNYTGNQWIFEIEELQPGWRSQIWFDVDLDDPGVPLRWYTNTVEIDTPVGEVNPDDNQDVDVAFSGGEVEWVGLWADDTYIEVRVPQTPVTITTAYSEEVLPWHDFDWNLSDPVQPGDTITVSAGAGQLPVVLTMPDPFTAYASSITDTVWGQINHLDHEWVDVDLYDGPEQEVQTDGSGHYEVVFPDMPRGGRGEVRYRTEVAYAAVTFHRHFQSPDLRLTVDYGQDWVGMDYEGGHTIYVTVTDEVGVFKANAVVDMPPEGGWWSTESWQWSPDRPDIETLDWVYGEVDNGYTTTVQVGTIEGEVNTGADVVSGTIDAPWFSPTGLTVHCEIHEENGESIRVDGVDPDGGAFYCDFGGLYDILPGDNVAVNYYEPDGDRVQNRPPNPAADLWTNKNGQGQPAPGGNYAYRINYGNEGDGVASGVVLSDALPTGMTYLTDTSGLSYTPVGNTMAWDVGTLDGDVDSFFDVYVEVDPGLAPGTTVTNVVEIWTPDYERDPEDNYHEWSTEVQANDTHLNVSKGAWTTDPAADTDVLFHVHLCNNGSTSSSEVTLTDTLHPVLTLVEWWSDVPGWTEVVSSSHQLVVSRPLMSGYDCQSVYLRAHVDAGASVGTYISNTAVISASNDLEGDDNEASWDGNVYDPHTNLGVGKGWDGGQLVPGGEVRYWIHYRNDGNVPVGSIQITDTLPVGTAFVESWLHPRFGAPVQITPTFGSGYLVWDVGGLENGYNANIDLRLVVDEGAIPGIVLTNTVEISRQPQEDSYDDNWDQAVETLNEEGPNLRVRKWSWWNGDEQLGYQIQFENIGSERIEDVWITDTLPLHTTWDGWWDMGFDWGRLVSEDLGSTVLRWQFSELYPGDSGWLQFNANLDDPGAPLRWYTNTVEIDTPEGDANPDDNQDVDVAFSGGEVERVDLWADDTYIEVRVPQTPVTITTAYTEVVLPWHDFDWNLPDPVQPGDTITVAAGAGQLPVVLTMPDPYTARASSITDTVWGQIDALAYEWVEVDLDDGPDLHVQTDGSGQYEAVFGDVPRGGRGDVWYGTEVTYAQVNYHRRFQSPDLMLTVDYGHDWVGMDYEGGHTIYLTVTDEVGVFKASAVVEMPPEGGWWSTQEWQWSPDRPDIEPLDWVYGAVDNGYTTTVQVGTIEGEVNTGADVVSGTLDAPWFSPTGLTVYCEIHEENGESIRVDGVDPDGGAFYCDFGGLYDILPGDNVAVNYYEPDGDRVQNHPPNPAADLWVNKYGQGQPAPGGNYVYRIQYGNEGDAVASGVVLSDALPTGMTYLEDTSGSPHSFDGNTVVWDLGALDGDVDSFFDLYVEVDPGLVPGAAVTNVVEIWTPDYERDPGDNYHEWSTDVQANETHLWLDKWAWTGDPAAETDFVFELGMCNDGSTASSATTLTDTLHPALTLVEWWSGSPGWTEESSSGNQLVLSRLSVGGHECPNVYLRVHVDASAAPGTYISNTAVISASNDLEDDDNETYWDGNVNEPHANLHIDKSWSDGQLTPGGELRYWIDYGNDGNVPVGSIQITDTLPVSTTFVESWLHPRFGAPVQITPTFGSGYLAWDVGGLENGYNANIDLRLVVDGGAIPGTLLTNTVEISRLPGEDSHEDNQDEVVETLYAEGPNLRVSKESGWHGDGQLGYRIHFENIGSETIEDAWITDTLPLSTTWDGWWDMDFDWGRLLSDTQSSGVLRWQFSELYPGESGWLEFNADLDDPGTLLRWYTNTVEIETPPGDANPADNQYVDVAFSGGEVQWVGLWADDTYIEVRAAQTPVTITTAYSEVVLPWHDFDWNLPDAVQPGDTITVAAGAGQLPVVLTMPDPFTAYASSITDTVWGQINHLDHEWVDVDLYDGPDLAVQTDGDGHYEAVFADIPRASQGDVRYRTEVAYADVAFHRRFETPDLAMRVNYGHDWIEGRYEVGHTLWITVTESDGSTIKAIAQLTTQEIPWWGGDTGFSTNLDDPWVPGRPDIQPGDWVSGTLDTGDSTAVRVGTINGELDLGADTVSGTIHANWFTQTLRGNCGIWEDGGPGHDFDVDPDGGSYLCDFTGEWDLVPGDRVGVQYDEPEGNQVINVFREPVADLWVNKYGQGQPAPGGNYVYRIQYGNEGDAVASGVVLSDALPTGMTYLEDTSGSPHSFDGNTVVWDLGALDGDVDSFFDLYVEVDPGLVPGTTVTNVVEIWTPDYERDRDDNYHEWWTDVQANQTQLNLAKWSWTGDPAPDSEFVFRVNPCSNEETASSRVTLTDTLGVSLTLQSWWGDGPGWSEVSSSGSELVVTRPSIGGWDCTPIWMRVRVDADAWAGMYITNTAVLSASNDLDPGDNETFWDGEVNEPHTNLSVNKGLNGGQLVPGGELRYWIDYDNNGNVPVASIQVTDTLPAHTSFVESWLHRRFYEPEQITPTIGAGTLVWDLGALDNGYSGNIDLWLAVDGGATPGTTLTNTVDISRLPDEDSHDDNQAQVVEMLYDVGPNLRVYKWHEWEDDDRQLRYNIEVENVGTTWVENVWVTDTYPLLTTFNDAWQNWGPWIEIYPDAGAGQVTYWIEYLGSGDTAGLGLRVDLDDPEAEPRWYTNTVEVEMPPGDVNQDDNLYVDVVLKGAVVGPVTVSRSVDPGNAPPVSFDPARITLDCSSGPGGTVTVTLYSENYANPPSGVSTMSGYWDISSDFAGAFTCDLTFEYDEGDLNGAAEDDIAGAARWDEGNVRWEYHGGTVDTGANTVTLADVTAFSPWLLLTSTPLRAVTDLGGTRSGSDLQLTWSAVTEDIRGSAVTPDHYVVYRRVDEPYFEPEAGDIIATPSLPSFTDPGILGDPAHNYYYVVTAVDALGTESALSNRLGAFDQALTPAAQADERAYNLVALNLKVPGVSDADALAAYVGPGVYMVLRHDAATQGIEWRLPGLAGTNFPVEVGGAYFLYLDDTAASVVSLVGDVPAVGDVSFALSRPEAGGSCAYNFISVPLHRDDLVDAATLAADIGGAHTVSRYNADTQDLTWWTPGGGENFAVRAGYPYVVCLDETAPSTWP